MVLNKSYIITRAQQSFQDMNINEHGNRVIISNDNLKCCIGKAFDVNTHKITVSAHLLLYKDLELPKLQYWNTDNQEDAELVLDKIFKEVSNINLYMKFHN